MDLLCSCFETWIVARVIAPFNFLSSIKSQSLPVSVSGRNLNAATNEQVWRKCRIGSIDLVTRICIVLGEEYEVQVLSCCIYDLLFRQISSVRMDRVHMEVSAKPNLLLLLQRDWELVDICGRVRRREIVRDRLESQSDIQRPINAFRI